MTDFTPRYYDRAGQPLAMKDWASAFKDNRLASDQIGEAWVSTVWLGLDHSFGDGPPLIFETMIFGGGLDQECWRYATEDDARAGHAHAVELAHMDQEIVP